MAVAGCAGTGSNGSTTGTGDDNPTVDSSHAYETMAVQAERTSLIVYPNADAAEAAADDRSARLHRSFVVTDADDAAALRFADIADTAAVRSFVAATDFDAASVLVDQQSIDDCYRRRLLGVRATDETIHTSYCLALKAPTTACEAETTVLDATLVRIHRPYGGHPPARRSSQHRSCSGSGPTDEAAAGEGTLDETATTSQATDDRTETSEAIGR
ncbi:hypothetical protein C487_02473 [Natrinema pallidum DSM 3751]|uniref:Uncharacterized protein n=3 Tax=Natrinema pallidum TaxID=69527 RepID=L9ZAR9_9EURY|nr:hypothetical protein C487_02473 [Natrinema pallidum DSM 3751]QCW04977.1 hypothetical protein FGF80_10350 [Natrinema pallidum]